MSAALVLASCVQGLARYKTHREERGVCCEGGWLIRPRDVCQQCWRCGRSVVVAAAAAPTCSLAGPGLASKPEQSLA